MNKQLQREIAARIKHVRTQRKLTQEEAAELVGLSYNSYVKLENGHTGASIESLMRVAKAFNVTVDTLLFGGIEIARPSPDLVAQINETIKLFDSKDLEKVSDFMDRIKKLIEESNK